MNYLNSKSRKNLNCVTQNKQKISRTTHNHLIDHKNELTNIRLLRNFVTLRISSILFPAVIYNG